jgi:transcriptional regulator with XRE-family HTH domain
MPSGSKPAPGPLTKEIAAILRERIGYAQVNSALLGEQAGMSRTHLWKSLNGRRQIDVEELDRVCFVLGLSLSDVVSRADAATASRSADPNPAATQLG